MNIRQREKKASTVLEISGSLTAANSAVLKENLQAALESTPSLVLILKDVDEVDLTFIQILVSAVKTARRTGKKLELKLPVPELVTETVLTAGLSNHGACRAEDCLWCQMQSRGLRSGING